MPAWLEYLLGAAVLAALAPVAAWIGRRHGRSLRGGLGLAVLMLGVERPFDPPPRVKVESAEPGKDARDPGDPPEPG